MRKARHSEIRVCTKLPKEGVTACAEEAMSPQPMKKTVMLKQVPEVPSGPDDSLPAPAIKTSF